MLQEESMTDALRSLAAELDELGKEAEERVPEIPDFQLTDVLGRGGMGTVYLAEQLSLGREVALKVVNSSVATSATLPAEARTVAQLHHPNIVQVYAAGMAQDQSWFAMELMRGKTANHSLFASAEDVARLGVQIAEALSYAHHCGVIHRDVKPSNIFIGENGMAKLGDFGLAAVATSATLPRGGTRRYMAPELWTAARRRRQATSTPLAWPCGNLRQAATPISPPSAPGQRRPTRRAATRAWMRCLTTFAASLLTGPSRQTRRRSSDGSASSPAAIRLPRPASSPRQFSLLHSSPRSPSAT